MIRLVKRARHSGVFRNDLSHQSHSPGKYSGSAAWTESLWKEYNSSFTQHLLPLDWNKIPYLLQLPRPFLLFLPGCLDSVPVNDPWSQCDTPISMGANVDTRILDQPDSFPFSISDYRLWSLSTFGSQDRFNVRIGIWQSVKLDVKEGWCINHWSCCRNIKAFKLNEVMKPTSRWV